MVNAEEIKKLDELKERYEQAVARYREHINSDIFDAEDERAYQEAYKAWRDQLNKVYGLDQAEADQAEEMEERHEKPTVREMLRDEGVDDPRLDLCPKELLNEHPTFAIFHALNWMGVITPEQEMHLVDRMDEEAQHGKE